jgi:hypothetical protein
MLRAAFPSYGPDWEAAIDYGIDVSLLLYKLDLSPTERLQQLKGAQRLKAALRGEDPVSASGSEELLRRMIERQVEFVVVGGVAAIAHGAAMNTDDLDVAFPFTVENLSRLFAALEGLNPRYHMTLDRRPVREPPEHLVSFKNLYLATDIGRLDLLGSLPPVGDYERVASRAEEVTVWGLKVRVVALEDLIAVKAHVGRPKDRHAELELRAIQELRAKRGG